MAVAGSPHNFLGLIAEMSMHRTACQVPLTLNRLHSVLETTGFFVFCVSLRLGLSLLWCFYNE